MPDHNAAPTTPGQSGKEAVVEMSSADMTALYGCLDAMMERLQQECGVRAQPCADGLALLGAPSELRVAQRVVQHLLMLVRTGEGLDAAAVDYAVDWARSGNEAEALPADVVALTAAGKPIKARSLGQRHYLEALKNNPVVLAVGPAGTGKTYLAMAVAVTALKKHEVQRIILSRPAVEAGERLGFLPGDLQQKIDPYLRPLYDALHQLLGGEAAAAMQEKGVIEVAPLAYMRGRTLSDAYIVLDEAQNTTREQMKMFLTRMGENSRVVVTGDISQIDLPDGRVSGLVQAMEVLRGVPGVATVKLTGRDVVRHEMVQRIVKAYERHAEGGKKR